MDIGEELGELLTRRCVAALGIDGGKAESYGKARHRRREGRAGACRRHPASADGQARAGRADEGRRPHPSAKKLGGPAPPIDVPLGP